MNRTTKLPVPICAGYPIFKNMSNQKNFFNRYPGLTIAIVLVVGIIIIDLLAGIFFIRENQASFRKRHPVYHHGMHANQDRMTAWGPHSYRMVTNSLGFRDSRKKRIDPNANGDQRLLLMGDSYTEGLGVPFEKSFAGLLSNKLKQEGVEVLNAAAVSYSPKLYYLKTKYLIEQVGLEFDRMMVFIDISDIQDEVTYLDFSPKPDSREFFTRFKEFMDDHSFLFHSISDLTSRDKQISNQFRRSQNADIDVWFGNLDRYKNNPDPEKGRFSWTVDSTVFQSWGIKGLKLARDHMDSLVSLCRENGIEVAIAVYPSPVQVFARDINSIQVRFWQEFSSKHQVPFLNLFPLFINEEPAGKVYETYFINGDTHWNAKGHRLVGSEVLMFINSNFSR